MSTSSLVLLGLANPVLWIAGAGVVAGFGGIAVADRYAVAKGLREVDAWGFRVEGYRAWLLADEPTFDVELTRDVDLDTVASSMRAIDAAVIVEKAGGRRFRVVTRRIALPAANKNAPVILVGDRRLLDELHQRVLAPLHADVGIAIMRMGERARLPLLLAAGNDNDADIPAAAGMGAFREPAMVVPPALQALVRVGAARELPSEARSLDHRVHRVVYATGSSPRGFGTVVGMSAAGAFSGAGWLAVYGLGIGAVAGMALGIAAAIQANRRNANRVAAVYRQPFPIEGYDDWLLSGRPLLDIEMTRPGDRTWLHDRFVKLRAYSVGAQAEVPWVEDVTWLGDQLVRIETRPTLIEPASSRIAPFYGGSHTMFSQFVSDVLVPLHASVGITAVRMGGYIDRRV